MFILEILDTSQEDVWGYICYSASLCHFFIVNGIISSTLQNRQGKQLHLQKCIHRKFTPQHVCLGNLVQTSQRKSNNINIFLKNIIIITIYYLLSIIFYRSAPKSTCHANKGNHQHSNQSIFQPFFKFFPLFKHWVDFSINWSEA